MDSNDVVPYLDRSLNFSAFANVNTTPNPTKPVATIGRRGGLFTCPGVAVMQVIP